MLCYSYMLITLLTRKGSAFYWSEEHFKKGRGLGGREGRKKNNKKKLLFWYTLGGGWFEETLFHFRFEKGRHFTSDMQTSTTTVCSALDKLQVNFHVVGRGKS